MTRSARRTADTSAVSRHNQSLIVEVLREHESLTRQQIVKATGLSTPTVTRLTTSLLRSRVLLADDHAPSTGGRPPIRLRLNPESSVIVAVDVSGRRVDGALIGAVGTVLHRERRPFPEPEQGATRQEQTLGAVLDLVGDLRDLAAKRDMPLQAVAAGVPGIVAGTEGTVGWAPSVQWRDVPLGALLAKRLEVPAFVGNDVNLMALAEHRRGIGRGCSHLAVVAWGTGLGSGLICGGRLHGGLGGAAGEIGYTTVDTGAPGDSDQHVRDGRDLEARIGAAGLARRAYERGIAPSPHPAHGVDLFLAVRRGDTQALALLHEMLDELAVAVTNLCALFAPELLLLGGGVGRSADLILPRLRERLRGRVPALPRMEAVSLGDDATLFGAAELALASLDEAGLLAE